MLKKLKKYVRFISVLLVLLGTGAGAWASGKLVGESLPVKVMEPNTKEIEELSKSYYDKFVNMTNNNPTDENIEDLLVEWEEKAPTGDFYKCRFIYAVNTGVVMEDNSDVEIPENHAFVIDGDYCIFRDYTVYVPVLENGIYYLFDGVHYIANRIDLWENLLFILGKNCYHQDLTDYIFMFLDLIEEARVQKITWIDSGDRPVSEREDYVSDDKLLFDIIVKNANFIVDNYPTMEAFDYYVAIYRRVVEVFPDNAYAYNELGYGIGLSDPEEALECFEKAYKLDKNNINHILNMAIYANVVNDSKKIKKYEKILYKNCDEKTIELYKVNVDYVKNNLR